jgi:transcriptional regulator NrdR family protein
MDSVVIDRPAECPRCGSTARRVLRIVRTDSIAPYPSLLAVRRRVICRNCDWRYTLLTLERRGQNLKAAAK